MESLHFDDKPNYDNNFLLEKEFLFIKNQLNKLNAILENNNETIVMSDSTHDIYTKEFIDGLSDINIFSALSEKIYLLDKLKRVQLKLLKKHGKLA